MIRISGLSISWTFHKNANIRTSEANKKLQSSGAGRFKRGAKGRYCTTEGGLQLAARRCISNCAAYTLGLANGIDVHGSTIRRYEVRLREARIASFRKWQAENYEALNSTGGHETGWKLAFHRLRFDASRANLYKKSKLNVSEILSKFLTRPLYDEMTWQQYLERIDCIDSRIMLGTLLRCQHGTMQGALGMVEKQFGSLAVPHWCGDGIVGEVVGLAPILFTGACNNT